MPYEKPLPTDGGRSSKSLGSSQSESAVRSSPSIADAPTPPGTPPWPRRGYRPRRRSGRAPASSVPSWQVVPNDAPEVFLILNVFKLSDELDCFFLGGCLIFVWPMLQHLLVIHRGDDPPTDLVITSDVDL